MPENSGSPIIGRRASAGFGFLLSVAGFPVALSIGSRSQTMTPQMPPPHLLPLTLASPSCVSQTPDGSPPPCASAGDALNNAAAEINARNVKMRTIEIPHPDKQASI